MTFGSSTAVPQPGYLSTTCLGPRVNRRLFSVFIECIQRSLQVERADPAGLRNISAVAQKVGQELRPFSGLHSSKPVVKHVTTILSDSAAGSGRGVDQELKCCTTGCHPLTGSVAMKVGQLTLAPNHPSYWSNIDQWGNHQ